MDATEQPQEGFIVRLNPSFITAFSFITGGISAIVIGCFWFSSTIATVPYVNLKHKESIDYTDFKAGLVLKEAVDHADSNKKDVLMEVKLQSSDIRTMTSKQDALMDQIKALQQYILENRRR